MYGPVGRKLGIFFKYKIKKKSWLWEDTEEGRKEGMKRCRHATQGSRSCIFFSEPPWVDGIEIG